MPAAASHRHTGARHLLALRGGRAWSPLQEGRPGCPPRGRNPVSSELGPDLKLGADCHSAAPTPLTVMFLMGTVLGCTFSVFLSPNLPWTGPRVGKGHVLSSETQQHLSLGAPSPTRRIFIWTRSGHCGRVGHFQPCCTGYRPQLQIIKQHAASSAP